MQMESFDIVVIGGGVGGYTSALRAAEAGRTVGLIEKGEIGGTCLNMGCIPTKALLESCRLALHAGRADEFGVAAGAVDLIPGRMVEQARSIVKTLTGGVTDSLRKAGVAVLRGHGSLVSPTEVRVVTESGSSILRAGVVVVATGSSWVSLPGIDIDGDLIITSDHALALDRVVGRIAIVGGGAVGCEFAEIYNALGAEVTIIEMMEHILPGEDAELARRLEAALKRKGIRIMTGTKVEGIERKAGEAVVGVAGGRGVAADRVLMGIGRAPNSSGLGLEAVGVEVMRGAIVTDQGMRTNVPGVFAVGDVTGKWLLAHVAIMQGIVAGRNAVGGTAVMDYGAVPRCVYTDPELAGVGLTESEALSQGRPAAVFRERLGRVGRALTLRETFGMAKAVYDPDTGGILGFQVLAPHASELLSEVSLAVRSGMTVDRIAEVIHPHPTLSELVWECFDGAARQFRHGR
jgi:dihydrolipoamide dehydrogenase